MNNSFFQGVSDYTISSFKMLKAIQSQTGGCEVIIRSSSLDEALSNLQQYNDECMYTYYIVITNYFMAH